MEELTIRQRNRLKRHYTMTSNVVLMGYRQLSDAEKITYQVIDSFDWSDADGRRKGYAYPSLATLARLRSIDVRTIRRHIAALEACSLLSRELRSGAPSVIWIEDPSVEEQRRYIALLPTPDTDVRPTPDKDVRPLLEEHEPEADKHVNDDQVSRTAATLAPRGAQQPPASLRAAARAKRDYYAAEIVRTTGDTRSLGCYRQIADRCAPALIFEALSVVKDASRRDTIRRNKGAMFVDLIKRMATERGITLDLARSPASQQQQQNVGPPAASGP